MCVHDYHLRVFLIANEYATVLINSVGFLCVNDQALLTLAV